MATNINYDTIDYLFKTISINCLILYIRYILFNFLGANPDNHPKEDFKLFNLKKNPNEDRAFRLNRISENDSSNMPYDMIVFFGAFIMNCFAVFNKKGESEAILLIILISVYTFFRICFSFCYLFALQPWRTICFVFTKMTPTVASCLMISLAFKIEFAQFAK